MHCHHRVLLKLSTTGYVGILVGSVLSMLFVYNTAGLNSFSVRGKSPKGPHSIDQQGTVAGLNWVQFTQREVVAAVKLMLILGLS
ncbi:hypothetical protein BDV33DRAFT_176014 [Aspergillus novoparasiticus]|uniref:Uncharacterized protein n=1 Tax=Aspergillus novoparasiticus TaxID=986946 RepID=A0A5N6EKK5_9EURO|nr:hypothetical protein BDV33DRAFT_176014 [Aspergillus novoparasiticus]